MNTMKALLKMTRHAAHLERQVESRHLIEQDLRLKLGDTERVAAERRERFEALEASLRERTAAPAQADALAAVQLLRSQGYFWEGSAWVGPSHTPYEPVPSLPEPCEPDLTAEPALPPKPEGVGWRNCTKAPPRKTDDVVEAVLFNGSHCTAPADRMDWSLTPPGVAWWRYA